MVKKNGRYYWLKLKHDFFNKKEIKRLRRLAGGDTYTIIYLQMLLLSLENDGKLYFDAVGDDFVDELALELDESIDDIKMTLAYLESKGMLEIVADDEYHLSDFPTMVGWESESKARVRRHREKKKLNEQKKLSEDVTRNADAVKCNDDVTSCNTEREREKEIEQELEIEQDIETEKNESETIGVGDIFDVFSELGFGSINAHTAEQIEDHLKVFEPEVIIKAMKVASDNNVRKLSYVNAVLRNWKQRELTTLEKVEAEEKKKQAEMYQPQTYQQKRMERQGEQTPEWLNKPKENHEPPQPSKTAGEDPEFNEMIQRLRKKGKDEANGDGSDPVV